MKSYYFEKLDEYIREENFFKDGAIMGCSSAEIEIVKTSFEHKIPDSIYEFMLNYGSRLPVDNFIFKSIYLNQFKNYKYLEKNFIEMKLDYPNDDNKSYDIGYLNLSEILLLFFNPGGHGDYMFYFVEMNSGEDPAVFCLTDGDVSKVDDSFSNFVFNNFIESVNYSVKNLKINYELKDKYDMSTKFLNVQNIKELKIEITAKKKNFTLPEGIYKNKSIQELSFYDGSYNIIKPLIESNKYSLKSISLWRINNVSDSFELPNGENIRHLALNQSTFKEIILKPNSLPKIEHLSISNAELLSSEIGNLSSLKRLSISRCSMKVLPDWLFDLKKLDWLYLYDCSLEIIPDRIIELENLTFIYLNKNRISESKLSKLRELIPDVQITAMNQSA